MQLAAKALGAGESVVWVGKLDLCFILVPDGSRVEPDLGSCAKYPLEVATSSLITQHSAIKACSLHRALQL
jgi:hypothetical protein